MRNLNTTLLAISNFFDRRLTHSYVRMICLLVISVFLLALIFAFASNTQGRTSFGSYLGADFGAFYVAGKIFNNHSRVHIYDGDLHNRLYREEFPGAPADSHLPYVNAPFFILPFTLFSRLPYAWAFLLWMICSVVLYVAGLLIIRQTLTAIPNDAWSIALLLSLSFMPFLLECLAGGQTSAVGFFFVALALRLDRGGEHFLSGLALSVCAYKPTLLVLILPMLLISRRDRILMGFIVGVGILSVVSLLGWQGCLGYLNSLLFFTSASANSLTLFRSWKYVDINSFFRLLLGSEQLLRWTMTVAVFAIVLPFLIRIWWHAGGRREGESLMWALTINWTLILNLYVGIYDTTLIVLSMLLLTDYISRQPERASLEPTFKYMLALLYLAPWITQPLARITHVQIFTVVLAAVGAYQIRLLRRLALSR